MDTQFKFGAITSSNKSLTLYPNIVWKLCRTERMDYFLQEEREDLGDDAPPLHRPDREDAGP